MVPPTRRVLAPPGTSLRQAQGRLPRPTARGASPSGPPGRDGASGLTQSANRYLLRIRFDVLVDLKQVRGVVVILQRHQPFMRVSAIGRTDAVGFIPLQVINIARLASERLRRFPAVSGPLDVLFRLRRVNPLAGNGRCQDCARSQNLGMAISPNT